MLKNQIIDINFRKWFLLKSKNEIIIAKSNGNNNIWIIIHETAKAILVEDQELQSKFWLPKKAITFISN